MTEQRKKRDPQFSRGTVIEFSHGEYSDYGTVGLMVTIVDVDLLKLKQQFVAEHKPRDEWDHLHPSDFPSWLVAQQVMLPIDCTGIHLGEYSRWDADFEDGQLS